jgi:gluconate 5-dehydrogenase
MKAEQLFDLTGKVAIVTGGGRGIGKALAEVLAANGAHVTISGRNVQRLEETASELQAKGYQLAWQACDVAQVAENDAFVQSVIEERGRLDIMVNNAGISPIFKPSQFVTEEEWDEIVDINQKGLFFGCTAAARHMIERGGGGRIINVSSMFGAVGFARLSVYCATKGAIEQLTRTMALEWAKGGICVNAIAPGMTETDFTSDLMSSRHGEGIINRIPLGRLARTDDLVGATLLLASDAGRYITGQTLYVDGGWLAA